MSDETYKLPRIYSPSPLSEGKAIALSAGQAHYFYSVMRRKDGDSIRVFNENDGEWIGTLENLSKKSTNLRINQKNRSKQTQNIRLHLFFTPLPKNRMDWLIEKSVELGVYALHPVTTQNTDVRKIKPERINAQIIEAAEQCERMSIPALHDLTPMQGAIQNWCNTHGQNATFLACLERVDAKPIHKFKQDRGDIAILIGPAGGFTVDEKAVLCDNKNVKATSLGDTILRAETAALSALSVLRP